MRAASHDLSSKTAEGASPVSPTVPVVYDTPYSFIHERNRQGNNVSSVSFADMSSVINTTGAESSGPMHRRSSLRNVFSSYHDVSTSHKSRGESATPLLLPTAAGSRHQSNSNIRRHTVSSLNASTMTSASFTSELPNERLKELCLRFIAARLQQQGMSDEETKNHMRLQKVRRDICKKMKSGFAAVLFASVLLHQRLVQMSKRLSNRRCDAYKVLPGENSVTETVGRALCVFPVSVPVMEETLLFALDQRTVQGHEEWCVFNVPPASAALIIPHLSGHKQAPAETVVICTYNAEQAALLPIEVAKLEPQSGPHHQIIRHFERQVAGAMEATEQLDREGQGVFNALADEMSIQLPTHQQLCVLPPSVRQAVLTLASDVLKRGLYPSCNLRLRRKVRERMSRAVASYPLASEALAKLAEFDMWPTVLLDELVSKLHPYAVDRGELVLHEGECPGTALYFLVHGTVEVVQKINQSVKSLGPKNGRVLGSKGALSCFGYYAFITAYPRMTTIRAATPSCLFWRVLRSDFDAVFNKLPTNVKANHVDISYARRAESLRYNMPLTPELVRKFGSFNALSDTVLKQLIPAFRAVSVPKGTVIANAEGEANVMYLLCRGHCAVYRSIRDCSEELHVETIFQMKPIGDEAVIAGGSHVSTIKAKTCCDMYSMTKEDFESVMRHNAAEWNTIVEVANKARQAKLQDSQYRFKDMAANIPIVASLLPAAQRAELTRLFRPTLYHPRQVVCSTAHFADKVIIVVEGQVRLQSGVLWEQGECSGFTCIVPHRWAMSAVSVTSSKLIELARDDYMHYLQKHGIFDVVKSCAEALMFPKAADPQRLYWTLIATSKLKNPAMYPVSESDTVNMHEPKFGLQVTPHGNQHVRVLKKAAVVPTALERSVDLSMSSIAERVRKRQMVHSVVVTKDAPDGAARWTRGKVLLVSRDVEEQRLRSVANHPIIKDYLAKRKRPVAFARPSSAQSTI